jgi:peptide/nickel transport system permease protein
MLTYILRRLLFAIPILLILSIIMFSFMTATFDPVEALRNPRMTSEDVQRIRASMGLDKPPHLQYVSWLGNFVTGDWGTSIRYQRDVSEIIGDRLVNTMKLMGLAVSLSFILALLIGIYSAVKPYSGFDYAFTSGSFFGISMPIFWFALIMQLVLGLYLMQWMGDARTTLAFLPSWFGTEPLFFTGGMHRPGEPDFHLVDFLRHATLPSLALMVQLVAGWGRYERASMMEIMGADYMRTARAKGLRERTVILRHGLRNALIPLVTVTAIDMGALFGGLIITEKIFSWPGMGSLFVDTIQVGDFPVILAWMMVVATFIILFNLIADIIYGVLDPRIRYG